MVAIDDTVYVIGGIDDERNTVDDLRVYSTASDQWSTAAPLPAPLHHVGAAVYDGKIYLLGGLRADFSAVGSTFEYDPQSDEWTPKTAMPAGSERGGAAVAVQGDVIVIVGGQDGSTSSALVSAYNPVLDSWDTDYPALPVARNHLVGAVVDDIVFAIGGRDGGIGGIMSRVDALEAGVWTSRADMPTARGGMAAGVVAGQIAVVGGEGNPADGSAGVFPDVQLYDPQSDSWRILADMPRPRHGMGAVGVGSRLYVPGGADRQGFAAVADHDALELAVPSTASEL